MPWEGWETLPAAMRPSGECKHWECLEGEGGIFFLLILGNLGVTSEKQSSSARPGQRWLTGFGKPP